MSTAAERQQSPDFEKKAFKSEIFEISVEQCLTLHYIAEAKRSWSKNISRI